MKQLAFRWCQRWRARSCAYRPAGEPVDPRRYRVEPIEESVAKAFVVAHHYSRSYPAAKARFGLLEASRGLVGVAVFSVPMNPRTVGKYAPGTDPARGVELGRFVLLDSEGANAETVFLRRCFRTLMDSHPELEVVLSFADPVPRPTVTGQLVAGHVGTCYQAFNGVYAGRSSTRRLLLAPDGRAVSPRMLSKIRNGERGGQRGGYAHRLLEELGATSWAPGESGASYISRTIRRGALRTLLHPGNHAYLWSLGGRRRRRRLERRFREARPYPKAPQEAKGRTR